MSLIYTAVRSTGDESMIKRPQQAIRLCVSAFSLLDVKLYYRSKNAVQAKRERVMKA